MVYGNIQQYIYNNNTYIKQYKVYMCIPQDYNISQTALELECNKLNEQTARLQHAKLKRNRVEITKTVTHGNKLGGN